MFNKEYIFNQLKEMGAPQDSVVLVHSSLKAVGEVEGRGEGFLDILIEYFTKEGGLLCIPTHTWAFAGNDKISLDLTEPKTCIGKLPDIAANREGGVRTLHPTHSMAVFGDKCRVKAFTEGEDEITTPTSKDGCYAKLFKNNGYILLVGVGHNRNTYLHSVEEILDIPNRISQDTFRMLIKNKDGSLTLRNNHYHKADFTNDVSARYPKFEPAFRHFGAIEDGFVGNAKTQLCSAVGMKRVLETVYKRSGGIELLMEYTPIPREYYEGELCDE